MFWGLLGFLSFIGFTVFGIMWIVSLVKKNGKAIRNIIISVICFVVFIISIVVGIGSFANEVVKEMDNDKNTTAEESEEDKEEADDVYGLGDTAEVGGIKFTVNSVSTTDDRNEFEEDDPNMVVKIEYELENGSDEEIPVGMDLDAYDGTGNQVSSYPLDNTMGSLKPGKKIQGTEHFGIEEGPIEIYFQPALSFFDDPVIFELEVE